MPLSLRNDNCVNQSKMQKPINRFHVEHVQGAHVESQHDEVAKLKTKPAEKDALLRRGR